MIGILTFQNTINFGAMLQTYALQKIIRDNNIEVEVINYICDEIVKNEYPLTLKSIHSFRDIIRYFYTNNKKKQQFKLFNDFYKEYVASSEKIYTKRNKDEMERDYDKIIVGSDQIWNVTLSGKDYTYFLDCVKDKSKKHTYAASFGYSQILGDEKKQKQLLSEFETLNIREKVGADIVEKLTGKKASVVLDPTLLLKRKDWDAFIKEPLVKGKYVFVYLIGREKQNYDLIKKYAKSNNAEIIILHNYIKGELGMHNVRCASPIEFLNYIKFADCIFTGSFHALCFSLIFEKQFFYTLTNTGRNSRIVDLMEKFKIEGRVLDEKNFEKTIKFELTQEILDQERDFSLTCLKKTIGKQ